MDPKPTPAPRLVRAGLLLAAIVATFGFFLVLMDYASLPGLPLVAGGFILVGQFWWLPFRRPRPWTGWVAIPPVVAVGLIVAGVIAVQQAEEAVAGEISIVRYERLAVRRGESLRDDDPIGRDLMDLRGLERDAALRRLVSLVQDRRPGWPRAVRPLLGYVTTDYRLKDEGSRAFDQPAWFCATFMTTPLDLTNLHLLQVSLQLERERLAEAERARAALLKAWQAAPPLAAP